MALVIPGGLLLPIVYVCTSWLSFADYRLPAFAPWCGLVLMAAALWLFWRSHVDLGLNWSQTLEIRKGHQLVRQGVYRTIRHPMYASIWLWCIAQGMMLENWLAGWYAGAAFAVMYFVRVPREERMLCDFFGEEYRTYMRQTGRLFPRLRAVKDENAA
jgi:protein-S-isoprenylcysteine O-methyltransferase Ste14